MDERDESGDMDTACFEKRCVGIKQKNGKAIFQCSFPHFLYTYILIENLSEIFV